MQGLLLAFFLAWHLCWTMDEILQELEQLPPEPPRPSEYTGTVSKKTQCERLRAYCQHPYNLSTPGKQGMEGTLAEVQPPQDIPYYSRNEYRCFCDPACHQYGDCCPDAVITMDPSPTLEQFEESLLASSPESQREWECHSFSDGGPDLYMIGSCPAAYENSVTANRCRRQVPKDEYNYKLDIPVLSQETNLTYVNVYCAVCNGDTLLHQWDFQIKCPLMFPNCWAKLRSWLYMPGHRTWGPQPSEHATSIYGTFISLHIMNPIVNNFGYYQQYGARLCRKHIIGTCPDSWASNREKVLCRSYALLVDSGSSFYKNEYCAICNGETAVRLECPYKFNEYMDGFQEPEHPHTSFAVLIDFSGRGSQVGATDDCDAKGLGCGFGELCDPVHQECRAHTCDRTDAEERCVQTSEGADGNFTDLSHLDNACSEVYLTKDDFVRHANNSVHVIMVNKTYDVGQYEVVNSTTILICTGPIRAYASWKFSATQTVLSKVCVTLSLICLAAHVVIHIMNPALRNLPGKNMLSLSVALFMAQVFFEFGVYQTSFFEICVGISMTIHFGFLSSFLWMNVIAVDVFATFASISIRRIPDNVSASWKFRIYSAYAWSTAFIFVLLAFLNDITHYMPGYEPMYGATLCWINNRQGLLTFFVVPLAILLTANVVFFSLTVTAICRTKQQTKLARNSSSADSADRITTVLYVKLALIMGLTWVFGFVAALANMDVIWYIFILLNSLQGTFIFIAFSCKRSILRKLPKPSCS